MNTIIIGNRIPYTFFRTQGAGQSDNTIHAGSYHLALQDAGIERCNIITYSSILPKEAIEIPKPNNLIHGSVMECILSVSNGTIGNFISTGLIFNWLYNRESHEKYGGLVCELNIKEDCKTNEYDPMRETKKYLINKLRIALNELYDGYSNLFYMKDEAQILYNDMVVTKEFGTVLVGLCFTSYIIPMV